MKKVVVVISILLSACGGAVTEARTDTAAADVDKAMPQSNTTIPESIDVRHKYSYVKLIEDGSKVAGLLELYGTNDYTQAVTINGYTQSGRGTFYVNGDKVTLSRTSGIAIDGVLDITKGSDNKLWLTLTNGVTYVEDDNSSFLKSMTVTPSLSNVNSDVNTDNTTSQNTQPAEIVYQGTMTDTQSGVSQDYTLYLKSDFSAASIGGGPYIRIEDQRDGTYMWLDGTIIGMSFYLDKLEELYNNLLKEYMESNVRNSPLYDREYALGRYYGVIQDKLMTAVSIGNFPESLLIKVQKFAEEHFEIKELKIFLILKQKLQNYL